MPCALLIGAPLTLGDVVFKNLVPVVLGNFIAGAAVVAASYAYQFGMLGKKSREKFRVYLKARPAEKALASTEPIEEPVATSTAKKETTPKEPASAFAYSGTSSTS